jgi:hypothetical protein
LGLVVVSQVFEDKEFQRNKHGSHDNTQKQDHQDDERPYREATASPTLFALALV